MKNIKRLLALVLCLMMVLTACGTTEQPAVDDEPEENELDSESTAFKAGTYSATKTGYAGPLTVEVTVDEGSIKDIILTDFNDTVMVGTQAFETISKEILQHQTLNVDMVSGATISSAAVIGAVTDALTQAQADIDALKAKTIEKEAAGQLDWQTEVLIIGSGMAGMSAAIEAANKGAKVIMLEKLGRIDGTTTLSAGWVHAAGTTIQERNGIEDNVDRFYEDWMMFAANAKDEYVEEELVRYTTENSPQNIQWLKEQGVIFSDNLMAAGIYEGRNIPRIHMVEGGNGYIMKYLFETAEKVGVETHLNTPATELIKEGNKVVGAKAVDKDGNQITIKAEAVIIASGGFAGNKELMAKYYPQYTDYVNTSVNTGDSLMFAEAVGADIIVKNALQLHHNLINDTSLGYFTPECIYVTPEGERYVDEAEYFYTRTRTLNEKGFGDTHMIVPHELYEAKKESIEEAIKIGRAFKADTVEELAELMDMDPLVFKNTIDRYNELVEVGVDSDFNKPSEYLFPIEAPYIGLDLTGNLNDTYVSMRINNNAQVIDTEGNIIEGLYAAGAAASAQTLNQEYIGSGSALLNGLTFGRVAAAHAVSLLEN
ncbi:MAG: FAD-dependent oxidoreductase [Tissierellia bacterium]|nr:FAD-dependent oxidoreductase [Tissierellia bacterium]